jgi:hypothetical protein
LLLHNYEAFGQVPIRHNQCEQENVTCTKCQFLRRDQFFYRIGPQNPFKTQQEEAIKNTLSGYVEAAHFNEFQFETQRRTFHSYGYAHDPSAGMASASEICLKIS